LFFLFYFYFYFWAPQSQLEGKGEEEMFVVCEGENAQGVVTVSVFPSIYIHTMMLDNSW
jgi:hypothetical protein